MLFLLTLSDLFSRLSSQDDRILLGYTAFCVAFFVLWTFCGNSSSAVDAFGVMVYSLERVMRLAIGVGMTSAEFINKCDLIGGIDAMFKSGDFSPYDIDIKNDKDRMLFNIVDYVFDIFTVAQDAFDAYYDFVENGDI